MCRGRQSGSTPPSPLVGQTEKGLAQQDELRNSVWSDPDNGVLVKVSANGFGRLQGQAQSEEALLCRPFGAFFAAGAFDGLESQFLKFGGKLDVCPVVDLVWPNRAACVVSSKKIGVEWFDNVAGKSNIVKPLNPYFLTAF